MESNRPSDEKQLLQTLIRGLAGQIDCEKALCKTLYRLANPALMEAAVDAGVFRHDMHSVLTGYLTITKFFHNVSGKEAARPIAQKALRAMDADGSLGAALITATANPSTNVSTLLGIGADPNELLPPAHWSGLGCVSALGHCLYRSKKAEDIKAMLQRLADEDRIPVARSLPNVGPVSIFDECLRPLGDAEGTWFLEVAGLLTPSNVPHAWELEIGAAIERTIERYGDRFPQADQESIAAALATKAIMPAQSWLRLMKMRSNQGESFAASLAETDFPEVQRLVENMIAAGVHPDDVSAVLPRMLGKDGSVDQGASPAQGTLLQAAVAHDNPLIVEVLLLHGADPRAKFRLTDSADSEPINCFELVSLNGLEKVAGLLNAWLAKDAINDVLAKARSGQSCHSG
jgi:hypothetical protein